MKRCAYNIKIIGIIIVAFLIQVSFVQAGQETERFSFPDVRDDFCGVHINFQYCKCAFHNEYCDAVGMGRGAASTYVWDQYREWVRGLINTAGAGCEAKGGIWSVSGRSCTICTDDFVKDGNACIKPEEASDTSENDDTTQNECAVDENFDTDWQKYSDIDERFAESERSYEAAQYVAVMEQIVGKKAEVYNYKVAMEADRLARLELRNIRMALVQNIKVNLLKAFWRLSYITYTTIESGASTGKTYVEFLSPDNLAEGVAKGIRVIQANVPSDSSLVIDTSDAKGKVQSIGVNTALEALENAGDPVKVVTKVFDDSVKSTFPSADISSEEVAILHDQYIRNRGVDMAIQESYLINSQRRMNVLELEAEIAVLEAQAAEWKNKEKARVKDMLEQDCKEKVTNE